MNIVEQTKKKTLLLTIFILTLSWCIGYLFLDYEFNTSLNKNFKNIEMIQPNVVADKSLQNLLVQKDKEHMYKVFSFIGLVTLIIAILLLYRFNYLLKYFANQVYIDSLTGLKNRLAINSEIDFKKSHNLILSNIKSFSLINELYGFKVGNKVLIEVANTFRKFGFKYGFDAYRISSDEFVLCKEEEFFDVLECSDILIELHKEVNSLNIWLEELDDSLSVEIVSGVAHNHEHILEDAQMAIKMAKERGLPYLAYAQKIDTKKQTEIIINMKRTIRNALEHNNVVPFFQPICNKDGVAVKYEALMRILEFDDGIKSVLTPDKFLDIAIKSGLYVELAQKMLTRSLSFFKDKDEKISVNLLPKDFFSTHIMDILVDSIKEFKNPQKIVLEITEQEEVEDFQKLAEVIEMLKKYGVQIAIDDFGSGYANYAHILMIKPDYLKIDGSLIKNIIVDEDSRILVQNIIHFCKDLGITIVAEYVKDEDIFNMLREFEVEEYQGYYFSKPLDLING